MIPGILIALLTFPGVIVHELAHQLFCRLTRTAVYDVCYFRFGNPSGYVIHEPPTTQMKHVIIGIGPFLVNSILGALIAFPAVIPACIFSSGTPLDYFLVWLGVSIAMHAFPSRGDAKSIWAGVKQQKGNVLVKIAVAPIVAIIYLGAFGSVFWLDLFYGVVVVIALPATLTALLA